MPLNAPLRFFACAALCAAASSAAAETVWLSADRLLEALPFVMKGGEVVREGGRATLPE